MLHDEIRKEQFDGFELSTEMFFGFKSSKLTIFNISLNIKITVEFSEPINEILYCLSKIYIFMNNTVYVYRIEGKDIKLVKEQMIIWPGVKYIFPLKMKDSEISWVFIHNDGYYVSGKSSPYDMDPYEKFVLQDDYLIFLLKDGMTIYKKYKGLIYQSQDIETECLYINHNKIYKIDNLKIIGIDLQLYLTDIKEMNSYKIDQFAIVENKIVLLFDDNNLLIYDKTLRKCLFREEDVRKFKVNDNKVIYLRKSRICCYTIENVYTAEFKNLEETERYLEAENEFERSDSQCVDIKENQITYIEN